MILVEILIPIVPLLVLLIGYKNFNERYFKRFIRFVPEKRSQFNSAFMYIYVNCLEEKFLKQKNNEKGKGEEQKNENDSKNKDKSDVEDKSNDDKKGEGSNPDPEKKIDEKKGENIEKMEVEENKNDTNPKKDDVKNSEKSKNSKKENEQEEEKKPKKIGPIPKVFGMVGYNYTAFKKIMEFFTKEINI